VSCRSLIRMSLCYQGFCTRPCMTGSFTDLLRKRWANPLPSAKSGAEILLDKDGTNIAEYLLQNREKDGAAFRGIVETLQYILPSATDLATALTDELEKQVYLKVSEFGYETPGWLVSSGTIRILAILGLLRHPRPQPLIVVEEIENGLDPRAAQLILEEIRSAVDSGKVQVILTTHSPYLLNLVPIDSVILVERISGKSVFSRPAGHRAVSTWAEKYAPGELYTMGVLSGTGSE
jgi:predicted ATPase